MSSLTEQFADILVSARGERSLYAMAKAVGVHRNSLLEVERGQRSTGAPVNLTFTRAEELAERYGVRLVLTALPLDADTRPDNPAGKTARKRAAAKAADQ